MKNIINTTLLLFVLNTFLYGKPDYTPENMSLGFGGVSYLSDNATAFIYNPAQLGNYALYNNIALAVDKRNYNRDGDYNLQINRYGIALGYNTIVDNDNMFSIGFGYNYLNEKIVSEKVIYDEVSFLTYALGIGYKNSNGVKLNIGVAFDKDKEEKKYYSTLGILATADLLELLKQDLSFNNNAYNYKNKLEIGLGFTKRNIPKSRLDHLLFDDDIENGCGSGLIDPPKKLKKAN